MVDCDGSSEYSNIVELGNTQLHPQYSLVQDNSGLSISSPEEILELRVFNTMGEIVWEGRGCAVVDLSALSPGLYIVSVIDLNGEKREYKIMRM
jgi:hypothetical protein